MKFHLHLILPVLTLSLLVAETALADGPALQWQRTFGRSGMEQAYSVQQTADGGYIIAGQTDSFGEGDRDVYLVKTRPNGEMQWERTFGGDKNDYGYSVQQTSDGGYVIVGRTHSFTAGGWYGRNYPDVYLIKTDSSGTLVWQKSFGGKNPEEAWSVKQTIDGGYIMAGEILHTGPSDSRYHRDVYLIKTDPNGNQQWEQELGGIFGDFGKSVDQTTDGGYIITGYTSSFNPTIYYEVYLVRTDSQGNLLWQKTFGGDKSDVGWSVQQTTDGGYIIAGGTHSFGIGSCDVYLIKTDQSGNSQWQKALGGIKYDRAFSVHQAADGGYIISGWTDSFGSGRSDVYIIKTDSNGNIRWQKTFGGADSDVGYSVQQTTDGGYIIAGLTKSFGAGSSDVYLIKLGPNVIFVDDDANGLNDGSSWGNAYNFLQDALTNANSSKPVEIRVAQGTYRPDEDTLHPDGTSNRSATFQLINGVTLKGGYAGFSQPDPNAQNIELYETILSGDLENDDGPEFTSNGDNSYHVVTADDPCIDKSVILDGFTITGGNANGYLWFGYGGGIFNVDSSPTIKNCIFRNNYAKYGGGMSNWEDYEYARPTVIDCVFRNNKASEWGGAIDNTWASPDISNCFFFDNNANRGGGVSSHEYYSSPTINNCVFYGNSATQYGGGMYYDLCSGTVTNCTFSNNTADYGNSVSNTWASDPKYTNCIMWSDFEEGYEIYNDLSWPSITYCDIKGSWPGVGNIYVDPCFADVNSGDYHLKSQAGRWNPNSESWVQDDVTSPCIDAGDPASPIGLEPFPNGGIINMGAYGGTAEASKSYFGKLVCEVIVAGDINGDCEVNSKDFALMALHWLEER